MIGPRLPVHRFSHQAMGTFFEVLVAGEEESYAGQAARAAFQEVDRLERLFSRFDPASEIARTNRLKPGEEMIVGIEIFECLSLAEEARRETAGAFDINARAANPPGSPAAFEVIEDASGFLLRRPPLPDPSAFIGIDLDLGGIGKGYAVDRALDVLQEWSIENALINGGTSTVLALGSAPPDSPDGGNTGTHHFIPEFSDVSPYLSGWPVGVGAGWPGAPRRVGLSGRALSGSGTEVKGGHIVDPRTGEKAKRCLAAWASHPSAAVSDALSTAFFIMTADEVAAYCSGHPDTWACLVIGYGDVRIFNPDVLVRP